MIESTLYRTTRQTLVERVPVKSSGKVKAACPAYVQPDEDQQLEMVLLTSADGVRQWTEASGKVLTIARTSQKVADSLRVIALMVGA